MQLDRSVALVGRPNVGKSSLFNRLLGRRIAIVHDMPGVTRDLIIARVSNDYIIIDTGGIGICPNNTPKDIYVALEKKVNWAIRFATIIVLIMEVPNGVTGVDYELVKVLLPFRRKVIVVANKIDLFSKKGEPPSDFFSIGFNEVFFVSASQGIGCKELHQRIVNFLGLQESHTIKNSSKEKQIRICLCGRQNVGKSSLGNAIFNEQLLIVSSIAGTTRDAVEHTLYYTSKNGQILRFILTDTAGIRPHNKLEDPVDYFSNMRTKGAVINSDICLLIIDASFGITQYEKTISSTILESGSSLIVVINKWDLLQEKMMHVPNYEDYWSRKVRKELFFLPESPIIFTSAHTGFQVEKILKTVSYIAYTLKRKLPTGKLNKSIKNLVRSNNPNSFKIYYAVHVGNNPFCIRLYCNNTKTLKKSYELFLKKGLRKTFNLIGCPILFVLIDKQ